MLWSSYKARPDTLKAIRQICTRETAPYVDDGTNLKRLLQFINYTITDERFTGGYLLHERVTWIDSAYDIHTNMRGHKGGCIYFGKEVMHIISTKKKPNTRSTCEYELVGISEYSPLPI